MDAKRNMDALPRPAWVESGKLEVVKWAVEHGTPIEETLGYIVAGYAT